MLSAISGIHQSKHPYVKIHHLKINSTIHLHFFWNLWLFSTFRSNALIIATLCTALERRPLEKCIKVVMKFGIGLISTKISTVQKVGETTRAPHASSAPSGDCYYCATYSMIGSSVISPLDKSRPNITPFLMRLELEWTRSKRRINIGGLSARSFTRLHESVLVSWFVLV